jgi:DNA-binding transcriptional LysR family regulator
MPDGHRLVANDSVPDSEVRVDLDLRKLRYFLAVAEELSFTKGAQRLHITQPVLSRQIRLLETQLKVQLFIRDSRSCALTAAGHLLLLEAATLVADANSLQTRLARLGAGTTYFTVGFMPGLTVTQPVRALASRHPEVEFQVLRTTWIDQVDVLLDGRVDVGCVRMPIDTTGLHTEHLFSEPRLAAVPVHHRLATRADIRLAELAGETMLQHPAGIPEWQTMIASRPDQAPDLAAMNFRSVEEKLEAVAAERGVSVLPESTACYYRRSDITYLRITDIPDNEVRLAWIANRRDPVITEFAQLAHAHVSTPTLAV